MHLTHSDARVSGALSSHRHAHDSCHIQISGTHLDAAVVSRKEMQ